MRVTYNHAVIQHHMLIRLHHCICNEKLVERLQWLRMTQYEVALLKKAILSRIAERHRMVRRMIKRISVSAVGLYFNLHALFSLAAVHSM